MHRGKLTCVIAVALALCTGGSAAGSPVRHLTGQIEPSGTAKVTVSFAHRHGVRVRTYRFALRRVPMTCDGGRKAHLSLRGENVVPNDAPGRFGFGLGAVAIAVGGGRSGWEVAGRLVRPSKAKGTVRAFDTHTPLGDGETANCRSGLLDWSASAAGAG